jgi:inner membrane transporter RhtA
MIVIGIVSVQYGAGLADRLFGQVPPAAVTGLRLWTSALAMVAISGRGFTRSVRDLKKRRAFADAAIAISFGISLGVMNFSIYQAFARIPLGVAVTIEFLGPLAVAVAGSRHLRDIGWVVLAAAGVVLLTQGGHGHLNLTGVLFAGLAATCWAAYIVLSSATGRRFPGSAGLAIAMVVSAVIVTPPALIAGGSAIFRPAVLATGATIGILSSVIPYRLELESLRRIPMRLFGVWMSLEPAVAALIGLGLLGQHLSAAEWLAICCVMVACAGAASTTRGGDPPEPPALGGTTRPPDPPGRAALYHKGVPVDLKSRVTAWARPVLAPTPVSMRRLALAGVIADTVIMSTGAAVRLSASGLGCPDWPQCSTADIVASKNAGQTLLNTWIEFGNRLLNFPLVIIAALIFIAAWRFRLAEPEGRRRRGLVWLGAAQPLGVVAQAVIGGIVVLTKLNPATVSVHFLVSAAVVAAAVALHMRFAAIADSSGVPETPTTRRDLRMISAALVAVTCLMLTAGTVVTGTGPLAGDAGVPRYPLPLEGVTQLHADIGWLLAGLSIALMLGLRLSGAPRRAVRAGWIMLAALGSQGVIGYIQYFTHLPAGLVWVHVTGSVLVWIAVLRLFFVMRERAPVNTVRTGPVATVPSRQPEPLDR